jgi:hypothetical protein
MNRNDTVPRRRTEADKQTDSAEGMRRESVSMLHTETGHGKYLNLLMTRYTCAIKKWSSS